MNSLIATGRGFGLCGIMRINAFSLIKMNFISMIDTRREQKYIRILQKLNLSENEIKLYLAGIEIGEASVMKIAEAAKVYRESAYGYLTKLVSLGLFELSVKGKRRMYIASSPKKLLELVEKRRNDISKTKWKIADIIPELEAVRDTSGERPRIRYYEGVDDYYIVQDEALEEEEMLVMGNIASFYSIIDYKRDKLFIEKRVKKNIRLRGIYSPSRWADVLRKNQNKYLREVKIYNGEQMSGLNGLCMMFGQKVVWFNSEKELMIVVVESKEISAIQRMLFEELWEKID